MSRPAPLPTLSIIRGSYRFMSGAVVPAFFGSFLFAMTSFVMHYVMTHKVFGDFSLLFSISFMGSVGMSWFAMALRQGLGHERKGFMLRFKRDELMLGASMLGFLFVLGIVASLLCFLVFLLVMMIAAIGGGALTGADVASAPIFETPEAFRTFLTNTSQGRVSGAFGLGVVFAALLFLFWLLVRLSPFAAGAVRQQRFVVLQAMSWTRYQDRAMLAGGLATIGVSIGLIVLSRILLGALSLPAPLAVITMHLVACICLLIIVGFICEVYLRTAGKAGSD